MWMGEKCGFRIRPGSRSVVGRQVLEDPMRTPLVLYEALLQASVPATAARAVAEALETDMTSQLATKQDLLAVKQDVLTVKHDVLAVRQDIKHLEEKLEIRLGQFKEESDLRFGQFEENLEIRLAGSENRVVVKLGTLIVVLIGAAATLMTVLR
jgi:hypothetical protein